MKDQDRINLITNALKQSNMDALVCALPTNVLFISGYWPVVGTSGMIFNIKPAVYFEGFGGIRHCDMVLLTDHGPEVLTPFQSTPESLTVEWFL